MGILIKRQNLVGARFTGGGRVDGKWVSGSTTPLEIKASIQPLTAKEMQSLPEGRRASGQAYRLYSDDVLQTVQNNPDEQPDQVTLYSEQYELYSSKVWNNDIINHYKYIATRLTSK
jgi:hypothetical protein